MYFLVKSIDNLEINTIKIVYFQKKISFNFNENVEIPFLFFLYTKYINYKGERGQVYIIKIDDDYLVKKIRTPKINNMVTKVEEMITLIYENSISNHRDSGDAFIGKIKGMEIRFSRAVFNGLEIQKELYEITSGYGNFKKKINIYL